MNLKICFNYKFYDMLLIVTETFIYYKLLLYYSNQSLLKE